MGEATSQIEAHIENTREELGSNLQELEQKVKSVTDWKHHFQKNPMTLLGVAFGGGILLANMLGGRKNSRRARGVYNSSVESQPPPTSPVEPQPTQTTPVETQPAPTSPVEPPVETPAPRR